MEKNRAFYIALLSVFLLSCAGKEKAPVVAKVGGDEITEDYIRSKIADISPNYQNFINSEFGKRRFLDILINEKLIQIDARKSDISSSPDYRKQVSEMEKAMKEKLEEYKNYLLTKMWIEKLKEKEIKVGEDAIEEYYRKYPREVKLEQLIFDTYAKAERVYGKAKRNKRYFSKLVKEHARKDVFMAETSIPPIMRGEFIPELEDMAFKMKVGEIQGIVKTKYGYHILHKISSRKLPLNKNVKERIRKILEKKKFDDYLEGLRSKYKVEVFDENYK